MGMFQYSRANGSPSDVFGLIECAQHFSRRLLHVLSRLEQCLSMKTKLHSFLLDTTVVASSSDVHKPSAAPCPSQMHIGLPV
jgi:hypothetical protein